MAASPLKDVLSHWHKLFENYNTSTQDFYACVERGLASRKIPSVNVTRVKFSEGGLLSPNREYLRVWSGRYTFDMCAAPFGTGYFFSSWASKRKPDAVVLYLLMTVFMTGVLGWLLQVSGPLCTQLLWALHVQFLQEIVGLVLLPWVVYPLALFLVLCLIAVLGRAGKDDFEAAILAVPILGWVYERLFLSNSFYRIDTMLMFQSAVHSAMMEAIDVETNQKGARALTEDERKPIFHKLM